LYVHYDTADPFESVGGLFEHGFVDLLLGNIAYAAIPRPWRPQTEEGPYGGG
jgi:hypothetical protein